MARGANKKHKIRRDPAKIPLILIKIAFNFFSPPITLVMRTSGLCVLLPAKCFTTCSLRQI
jgi:hypothetical protein